jgi:hypothetical protein
MMAQTSLVTLTVRDLICLLAETEEQICRVRDGETSTDECAAQVRELVHQQHQVIGELRRRRPPAI